MGLPCLTKNSQKKGCFSALDTENADRDMGIKIRAMGYPGGGGGGGRELCMPAQAYLHTPSPVARVNRQQLWRGVLSCVW